MHPNLLLMDDLKRIQPYCKPRRVESRKHGSHIHDRQRSKEDFHGPVKPYGPAKRLLVDYENQDKRQCESQCQARKVGENSKQAGFDENQLANLPCSRAKKAKEAKLAAPINHQS